MPLRKHPISTTKLKKLLNLYKGTHKPFNRYTGGGSVYEMNDRGAEYKYLDSNFYLETEEGKKPFILKSANILSMKKMKIMSALHALRFITKPQM